MRNKEEYGNQASRLVILLQIFQQYTDEDHWLSTAQLLEKLEQREVNLESRALRDAILALQGAGYSIRDRRRGNVWEFALTERDFELAELKLLAAAVQSSRFLTEKKARDLTDKLKRLTSDPQAKSLNSGMLAYGRIRSMNESIYNNLDILNDAIEQKRKVRFKYFIWDAQAKKEYRRGGSFYSVSPYLLIGQNDKIYMVGYDDEDQIVKHFRVDKMDHILGSEETAVLADCPARENPSNYVASQVNMYGGADAVPVKLRCRNEIANVIVDSFGRNSVMIPNGDGTFSITVNVSLSMQFYGWVLGLHPNVVILSPEIATRELKRIGKEVLELYSSSGEDQS